MTSRHVVRTSDNAVSGCVTTIRTVRRRVALLGEPGPNFFEKKDSRRKCTGGTRSHNLFFRIRICCASLVHPPVRESWLQTSAQAASASLDSLSPRFALPHATMHHRDTPSEQNPNTGMWRPTKTPLGFSGSEEKN